ncbi:hypothetical protein HZC09_05025 [Candidatus Micrarchaeota archaeon]|nr:hypothetical protein [Candidatus Micrarchaeota archaeon]
MGEARAEMPWFAVLAAVFVVAMLLSPRLELLLAFLFMVALARPSATLEPAFTGQVRF